MKRCWILIGLVALAVAGCASSGAAVTHRLPEAAETPEAEPEPLELSGFLEAEEVSVVSEQDGRVAEVRVEEADEVAAGDVLIRLDDALLQSDRLEAEAAVRVAEANLAQVKADPRQEEVNAAQAAIEAAEARVAGAERSSGQAWSTAANPTDIEAQIATAQLELSQAQGSVDELAGRLSELEREIQIVRDVPEGEKVDQTKLDFLELAREQLVAQLASAEAQRDGAQQKVELLQAQRERPVALIADATRRQAQVPVAEAQLQLAQAQYDLVTADPLAEEIAIAEAQVALAEAQVALLDAQIDKLTLRAPIGGTVTARSIAVGETAAAGVPLLTIANLEDLRLIVYIPETRLGQLSLGAPVEITIGSLPGRTFEGQVASIGREAQFTPRNVQTEEERVDLVFAVEIAVDNGRGQLKPGMPADVVIEAGGER